MKGVLLEDRVSFNFLDGPGMPGGCHRGGENRKPIFPQADLPERSFRMRNFMCLSLLETLVRASGFEPETY